MGCLAALLGLSVAPLAPTSPLPESLRQKAHAAPAALSFQPLTAPATHRILPGKIVFALLVTPDAASARSFYGPLFDWHFRSVGRKDSGNLEIIHRGRPIGMIVPRVLRHPERDTPFWLPFLSTSDTAALAREARRQGGKVLFGPRAVPGLGQEAVISDPQKGLFAAFSSASGDPGDEGETTSGDWAWSSLLSPAPDRSAAFYKTLFDYDVKRVADPVIGRPLPHENAPGQFFLVSQGQERAGIAGLPPGDERPDKARWVQFMRVDNCASTAEQVARLGGRILVPPHMDRDGAMLAIFSDPTGAVFGAIEPGTEEKSR
ncbi:VOC family protein [Swaminathania salitolerans]|uniref:VOC domain-containing protein n=1 Tax=Swaminathania salitolerans TaxID=182838 RepID=A0A511BQJ8_9PROT|nr:VOC family protein [Swaminathania salitolerans]GBQ11749.1 glyoxalase/bleomycin resistance protein [Swaminathania salitolerans LMG 21291]GEL02610.1 hypothetical protein SSA02_17730 [Swaminathania salitolerans]